MSDTDRTDVSLKSIPYSSLPLLKGFKGAAVRRLPRPKSNKKTERDIYSIPSSTDSRTGTPEGNLPRHLPTPEPTPPQMNLKHPQGDASTRAPGAELLPDGDTIVVSTPQPPLRRTPRSDGLVTGRGNHLKRKRAAEPRPQTRTPPPTRKKTRSTKVEEVTSTSYETRSAAQSSRISPDLGTTIMDLGPPVPKTEALSEPFVPSFRWVDIASITFKQPNALSSLAPATAPSAISVEIPETPPSSPPLPAIAARVIPSPTRRDIVPKDETPSPTLIEPVFDISTVPVHFLSSTDKVMRTRPFHTFRNCIQRFFRAADGANIINDEIDKLTATIYSAPNGQEGKSRELNVMRDFEEDFEEMKQMMEEMGAERVEVRRGRKTVLVD